MSSLLSSIHLPSSSSNKSKASPSVATASTFNSPPSASPAAPTPPPASTAVSTFRSLVFNASISIQLGIAGDELPNTADRSIESYYIQAPRITYLPLLLAQVRRHFLDLVLDESSAAAVRDDDLWFSFQGVPLKWHWPIGLLYDYHTSHPAPSSSASSAGNAPLPSSLASVFAAPSSRAASPSEQQRTLRGRPSTSFSSGAEISTPGPMPWKLTLHIKDPPAESLLLGSSVEACRTCFMNMVKEADYVRWGSVKRVTNLRKEQQDGLWEGVVANNFDRFWSVASKLVPLPSPPSPHASRAPTPSAAAGSTLEGSNRLPDANAVRSVPIRVYLPEGAPVLQEVVPPAVDGIPTTLLSFLSHSLPLFFPSLAAPLAQAVVHGVRVPLESEVGWLGAGLAGADGWVAVVLRLV